MSLNAFVVIMHHHHQNFCLNLNAIYLVLEILLESVEVNGQ